MRWKPMDDRQPPAALMWPLVVITAPVWACLIALLWLEEQKRSLMGPSADWRPWFAWYPVRVWGEGTVWLEWIERRRHWNSNDYRLTA